MPLNKEIMIAVVDDLERDRTLTVEMTEEILSGARVPHTIASFSDSAGFLRSIREGKKYSVLILDVMMDEMDGMELADEFHRLGEHPGIIFVSTNREMSLYGYERSALRYLAKPLERDKLEEALLHCCALWHQKKEILLPTNRGQYRTSFSDIHYVEAFDPGHEILS